MSASARPHGAALGVFSPLGGKSKTLRNHELCPVLAWIRSASNERDFYFSVSVIKPVRLYKVFSKCTGGPAIVNPAVFCQPSCALGVEGLGLTLLLHLASGLLFVCLFIFNPSLKQVDFSAS